MNSRMGKIWGHELKTAKAGPSPDAAPTMDNSMLLGLAGAGPRKNRTRGLSSISLLIYHRGVSRCLSGMPTDATRFQAPSREDQDGHPVVCRSVVNSGSLEARREALTATALGWEETHTICTAHPAHQADKITRK
jgi:hypothetical protein